MNAIIRSQIIATLLILAPHGASGAGSFWLDENTVNSQNWDTDVLVLRLPQERELVLLVANGRFDACRVSSKQGGGAAIIHAEGKPPWYGCWWSLQRVSDKSVWVKLWMNNGTEMSFPMLTFSKRPKETTTADTTSDPWTEQSYQASGRRFSAHIDDVNHRMKILKALAPTFNEQQKTGAADCLKLTVEKLEQAERVADAVKQEHLKFTRKWAGSESDATLTQEKIAERRDDLGVVVDMAFGLTFKTTNLSSDLGKCLASRSVPFQ